VVPAVQPRRRACGLQDGDEVPQARHPVRLQHQQCDKGHEGQHGGGDAKADFEAVGDAIALQRLQHLAALEQPPQPNEAYELIIGGVDHEVPRQRSGDIQQEVAAEVVLGDGRMRIHPLLFLGIPAAGRQRAW